MTLLLAVDDDPLVLECYRVTFAEPDLELQLAATAAQGLEMFTRRRPDAVLLDVDLPDGSGMEVYQKMRKVDARVPTIFVTGAGTTDTAIEAMRLGAFEYILKPPRLGDLQDLVHRALAVSRLMRVPARVAQEAVVEDNADVLLGRGAAMQEVYKAIGRVAAQDVTVLIRGESGTGKELVARAIYQHSHRADKPFLAINCAAIPETLLESELFGYEKGAFTGAQQRRIGKFEQCHGGTLFLDEVGDMTPLTQTKILRVLQQQEFERVGGNETIRVEVRLIAATNRDLEKAVAAGQFRSDLYYRLNVYAIYLPPLRQRADDLPLLVRHFLRRFARELGKEVQEVDAEALELVRRYAWPGNIRELQSVVKHALLQATGPLLLPEHLPAVLRGPGRVASAGKDEPGLAEWESFLEERLQAGTQNLYAEWQALTDKRLFQRLLRHTGGNLSQAARILGIHRATLRTKLDALGLAGEETS